MANAIWTVCPPNTSQHPFMDQFNSGPQEFIIGSDNLRSSVVFVWASPCQFETKGTLSGRQSADIPTWILQSAFQLGVSSLVARVLPHFSAVTGIKVSFPAEQPSDLTSGILWSVDEVEVAWHSLALLATCTQIKVPTAPYIIMLQITNDYGIIW